MIDGDYGMPISGQIGHKSKEYKLGHDIDTAVEDKNKKAVDAIKCKTKKLKNDLNATRKDLDFIRNVLLGLVISFIVAILTLGISVYDLEANFKELKAENDLLKTTIEEMQENYTTAFDGTDSNDQDYLQLKIDVTNLELCNDTTDIKLQNLDKRVEALEDGEK